MNGDNGGKDLLQGLFEAAINHYSREAIVSALDYVAGLSEDDVKEMTIGMSPENSARVYRVWRATRAQETLPGQSF